MDLMTPEQRKAKSDRQRKWRANRTPEQRKAEASRTKQRRANPEHKKAKAEYQGRWRANRTPEQKKTAADYQEQWRANRTPEQKRAAAYRQKQWYKNLTPEQKKDKAVRQKQWRRRVGRHPSIVYFIQDGGLPSSPIKIGRTSKIIERLGDLQVGNPRKLRLLLTIPEGRDGITEESLHCIFADQRLLGEWFEPERVLAFIRSFSARAPDPV